MLATLPFTPANVLQCLFIFLGILASALLYPQTRFRGVMWLLIYFATLMAFNLLEELNISKPFVFITPALNLLPGPIIFYMANVLVKEADISTLKKLKHSLPALVALLFTEHVSALIVLGTLSQVGYLIALYKLLSRYDVAAFNSQADASELELKWLEKACIAMVGFMIFDLLRLNIRPLLSDHIYYHWYLLDLALLLCICCYLLVKSVRQQSLFNGLRDFEQEPQKPPVKPDQAEIQLIKSQLRSLEHKIKSMSLYKVPKLSVQQVSDVSELSSKEISWVINQASGKNFNDYINAMRIESVKAQLQSSAQPSILDVALECGFNSKSTFNLAFKKLEGITPSQYLKQIKRVRHD